MRQCARSSFTHTSQSQHAQARCVPRVVDKQWARGRWKEILRQETRKKCEAKLCWHFPQIASRMSAKWRTTAHKRRRKNASERSKAIPSYWVSLKICGWRISIKTIWCLFHPVTKRIAVSTGGAMEKKGSVDRLDSCYKVLCELRAIFLIFISKAFDERPREDLMVLLTPLEWASGRWKISFNNNWNEEN